VNPKNRDITPHGFDSYAVEMEELKSQPQKLNNRMRIALLVNGVDTNPRIGGLLSASHTAQDVAETVAAWREALKMLKAEGELPA
jgi:glutamate-1-semialdehyde aminotransferase